MKNKPEEAGCEVKIRCGICGNGIDTERAITLRCSHTFCFQCIKTNHETAVNKKQSESDKLYCPRCAEITAVPDGSVEKIRQFYLCNRVKDLYTLSQMNRELTTNEDQASENTEAKVTIDTRSYTIEGPTLEDVEEVEKELLERGQDDAVAPSAQIVEPHDDDLFTTHPSSTDEDKNGERTYSCSACQIRDVAYYCFQCGETLCGTCKPSHATNESHRSHYGIDIDIQRIQSLVCPTHSQFIRQFCAGCFQPVCSTCYSSTHENHERYEFCTPEEASHLMSEVRERRTASEYVLQELDKLAGKLSTHLVTINNEVDTFVQKTRSSDDFVAPLKGHLDQCLAEMQKVIHKMESELLKNIHSLNTYEATDGANIYLQGLGEFAIKYTLSELHDVVPKDLTETVRQETADILMEIKLQTEEQRCLPDEHNIIEQRDFCMAPILGEQLIYHCEEEKTENAFENETAESFQQAENLTQIGENGGNSGIGGENESVRERMQMEQTSESTLSVGDARSQALTLDNEEILNKARESRDNGATKSSVEVNISNVDTESCDGTRMHQPRSLKEEDQRLTEVIVPEACESPQTGPTAKTTDAREQQSTRTTHERLWSIRQSARSVAFLPSGIILSTGRDKLDAFDSSGRKLPVPFDTSVLTDPWKLAVHWTSSAVVVVDPTINAFAVFTPNSSDSERWNCETHCVAGIHVPMCAAFSDDGYVLLATGSGRTLLKYSVSGELVWQRSLAHDCYYLTTDTGGRIISSGGGSVHIHDENGIELHRFPECKEQLRDPWGVCTDSENNIYVCELNRPVVTVFSSTGKYLRELDLNSWPRDISVDGDKLLIATVHSIEMHQMKHN